MSLLTKLLDNDDNDVDQSLLNVASETTADTSNGRPIEGFCIECVDAPSVVKCRQCDDEYCVVCFRALHLKGRRASHDAIHRETGERVELIHTATSTTSTQTAKADHSTEDAMETDILITSTFDSKYFIERSKYVPLRLAAYERQYLRLLEASVFVSNYVDKIDGSSFAKPSKRLFAQLRDICSILSGIMFKKDYELGQEVVSRKNFADHDEFLMAVFELGRRYKILNPERLRSEYGKLMYVLQDAQIPEVRESLGFSLVRPIRTVYDLLERKDALALLEEPSLEIATRAITYNKKASRSAYDAEVHSKYQAKKRLIHRYSSGHRAPLSADEAELCLNSIGDNRSFLLDNLEPVKRMLAYLRECFRPDAIEEGYSLAIEEGDGGSRLTHTHERQYRYVEQSLLLWAEILDNFFELWWLADADLLAAAQRYTLADTGQGLQRKQAAPGVERRMRHILAAVQQRCTTWVGSSVVHLGDKNVPNALHFIDKYTQVARILKPVLLTLDWVAYNYERKTRVEEYVRGAYRSLEHAQKLILCDFFRFAFDGSGADNFFDAGSCIDGRLTSAWHWCQNIETKPFYPLFLLAGFTSFDGEFAQ